MKNITINNTLSIKDSMKKLDECATKVLFVVDDKDTLLGTISDGDIRRYILKNGDINTKITSIYNNKPMFLLKNNYTDDELKDIFIKNKIEVVPIVNNDHILVDYKEWNSVFETVKPKKANDISLSNIPVVIMAGGKGTRLKPFTDVLPKPLVPIKEKPIMDWIIEEFKKFGTKDFYATLNYRGKMIDAYYSSIEKDYNISFAWEKDFYGTAGSLKLLKDKINGTFIVSNCDIIVKANYSDVLDFHQRSNAKLTIVSSIQHHQIPYGVIQFSNGGVVTNIKEKPEYTHAINTGVYILEKECLDYIPDNEFFHITHLMERLIEDGNKIVTYPVNEKEYIDIGQWEEYMTAVDSFEF